MPNDSLSDHLQIAVVGDGGVGKSCITVQYISKQYDDGWNPTIHDAYKKSEIIDGKTYFLEILDTAGQEEYRALRPQYMRASDGFLLVCDLTNASTFEGLKTFVQEIKMNKEVEKFPCVLIGNKVDLADDTHRKVTLKDLKEFAEKELNRCPVFETSAKTGTLCKEVFEQTVRECIKFAMDKIPPFSVDKKKDSHKQSHGLFSSLSDCSETDKDLDILKKHK